MESTPPPHSSVTSRTDWHGCHLWQLEASYIPTPGEACAHGHHQMTRASQPFAQSWDWSSGRGACDPP